MNNNFRLTQTQQILTAQCCDLTPGKFERFRSMVRNHQGAEWLRKLPLTSFFSQASFFHTVADHTDADHFGMREKGLEPLSLAAPGSKPGVSANSTTPARNWSL